MQYTSEADLSELLWLDLASMIRSHAPIPYVQATILNVPIPIILHRVATTLHDMYIVPVYVPSVNNSYLHLIANNFPVNNVPRAQYPFSD